MNRRLLRGNTAFNLCAALFLLGCAAGVAASGFVEPDQALRERMLSPSGAGFLRNLFAAGRFHLTALFFAFSALGVAGIPAVAAVRGFLLCFSMCGTVRMFGAQGIPLALALVLPGAIVSIPCLFIICAQSFSGALAMLRSLGGNMPRQNSPFNSVFAARVLVCLLATALAAGAETLWGGRLVSWCAGLVK